jgi:membrane protein DedA with SNARE-associated domain
MLLASTGSQGADLDGVAGWAVDLMEKLGAPGAGLAIALENLFPPLPSELILPLVGALVMYAAGAVFGRRRLYAVWAKVPLLKTEDLERTEAWFARHGKATVFFGRMIPIFRSLISIPAGVERMPLLTFVVLTTLGSLVWNTVFVTAGYTLGEQWHRVEAYANTFQTVVIGAVLLVFALFVVVRVRSLRAER